MKRVFLSIFLIFTIAKANYIPYLGYKTIPLIPSLDQVDSVTQLVGRDSFSDYIDAVVKVYRQHPLQISGRYKESARAYDNTAALVGHFGKSYAQIDPIQEATAISEATKRIVELGSIFNNTVDSTLIAGDTRKHAASIQSSLAASVSYGYIAHPDKIQLSNYDANKRTYYTFRLNQQSMRKGVLEAHALRVVRLKQELNYLYSITDSYCGIGLDPRTLPTPSMMLATSVGGLSGLGGIITSVMLMRQNMIELISREITATCLVYLATLESVKAQIESTELLLNILSTNYNMLNNAEKGALR